MEPVSIFLSSSVIAALVAALVSLRTNERRIHIENVTQERAKWRNSMRCLADSLIKSTQKSDSTEISALCSQLALNVNPFDKEDISLIEAAEKLATSDDKGAQIKEFTERMSLLLKHDWERAKREAKPWFFRGDEARRISYKEFAGECPSLLSEPSKKSLSLLLYFVTLSFSAGIIFFLAVGLTEPFQKLVKIFNDPNDVKPFEAWVQFIFWSIFCGSMWSAAYLWFKASEKRFLEIWFRK
ncbi:hypothetical protein [Vibrio gazogenes]|uniref:Uncharacterized protein n=1 Tax=Vibrio gazogenes DSM 21264 = NBRC 103151 TaxID=1123492 RepID=A0A1M5HNZ2_VIBGA|nr:hypothetical protein [Vibrio gazogenes]USP12765.1 hypothetical protein MKS89_09960 [Vibrio gazogenes]SHG17618.1 hypothetical protein SAMN02745781_04153 [Vibrio gazogenes DSM 21264] [Vibrio gazogenes DSM 21264 = NBRC 103151]SJN57526.1 hypothetical protein BQ6471_02580 [Vibrio gazogenes]